MATGFIVSIWSCGRRPRSGRFLSLVETLEPFQVKRHSVIIFLGRKWGKLHGSRSKRGISEISLTTDNLDLKFFCNFPCILCCEPIFYRTAEAVRFGGTDLMHQLEK